jgi:hypothetical protein
MASEEPQGLGFKILDYIFYYLLIVSVLSFITTTSLITLDSVNLMHIVDWKSTIIIVNIVYSALFIAVCGLYKLFNDGSIR